MFLISTLFTILLLWGCVFAEQWRQVWVLGKYEGTIEGSKKFSDGESTTWLINCVNSVPGCTFPRNLMLTESSVAISYNYTLKNNCSFNAACRLNKAAPSGDCVLTLQSGSSSSTKSTRVGSEVLTRATMLVVAGPGETSTTVTSTTHTSTTISSTADSSTTASSSSTADIFIFSGFYHNLFPKPNRHSNYRQCFRLASSQDIIKRLSCSHKHQQR